MVNETIAVGVVGAGTMGAGIAQLAAAAGCPVFLIDVREGAAQLAAASIARALGGRVAAGKMASEDRQSLLARLTPVASLHELKNCDLIIEAIAESLSAKRALLLELEHIVRPACILGSNTSSLSISALARDLTHRGRLVGIHFFNPVHSMALVEVVAGADTEARILERAAELVKAWGKTPVLAKSTPGFIVNRIARPYYAEALCLIQEAHVAVAEIDLLLRGAGFRMGPCELMDLIGHDVNLAVTESIFHAYYFDRRFTPSVVQRELVDAGRLGRKSGRGFYEYADGAPIGAGASSPAAPVQGEETTDSVVVRGRGALAEHLARRFARTPFTVTRQDDAVVGLDFVADHRLLISMRLTDGRAAAEVAASPVGGRKSQGVFDLPIGSVGPCSLAVAFSPEVSNGVRAQVKRAFESAQVTAVEIADCPALVVARTVCMIINEAADAVQQQVCTVDAANTGMRLGVNYPAGPFEWLEMIGTETVVEILNHLAEYHRGERYRVSPWLQQRRWHAGPAP